MKHHIITIPTNNAKIYKQILSFMNFLIGATNQEREVLAELIRLNHEYEALPPEKRAKFILSTDMRKEIREELDIEEKQFNGIISRLKGKNLFEKPLLDNDNVINSNLLFKPDDEGFKIEITLKKVLQTSKKVSNTEETKKSISKKPNSLKKQPKEKKVPLKEIDKKMATPANGIDNIVGSNLDGKITLV